MQVGDLIYIKGELNKTKTREKYMIVDIKDELCYARKFTASQF
jgi:hypothetical protein